MTDLSDQRLALFPLFCVTSRCLPKMWYFAEMTASRIQRKQRIDLNHDASQYTAWNVESLGAFARRITARGAYLPGRGRDTRF